MDDAPWNANFAEPEASADKAPSSPQETGPWSANFASTPEEEHQARIAKFAPEQEKIAKDQSAFTAALPTTLGDVPGIGPWAEKGYAKYKMSGTENPEKYGTNSEERYRNYLAEQEAYRQARGKAHPIASYGPGIIGGLGTALAATAALPAELVAAPALGATGLTGALIGAATTGAGIGALQSAGEAAPGSSGEDIKNRAISGGASGALLGPAGTLIGKGATSALAPVGRTIQSALTPKSGALSDLAAAAGSAAQKGTPGLSVAEAQALQAAGHEVLPTQIQGVQKAAQTAANTVPDSETIGNLNRALESHKADRSVQFQTSMDNINQKMFGAPVDIAATRQAADYAAKQQFQPLYRAAFSDPAAQRVWLPEAETVLNSSFGNKAVEDAVKMLQNNEARSAAAAGRTANVIPNPFVKNSSTGFYELPVYTMPNGKTLTGPPPNLEFWDAAKRSLGDQYEILAKSTSDMKSRTFAGQLAPIQKEFTEALTTQFPKYETALDFGRRYFGENNAFDAGLKFFQQASGATQTDPQKWGQYVSQVNGYTKPNGTSVPGYTPTEIKNFQQGLLAFAKENPQAIANAFADKKGAGELTKQNFDAVKKALPPQLAQQIENSAQMMNISSMSQALKVQEPQASGNLVRNLGILGGLGVGAESLKHLAPEAIQHLVSSPTALAMAALTGGTYAAKKIGSAAYNAGEQRRAETLLRMLESNDPNTIEQIKKAMATNKNVKQGMDAIESAFTQALASNSASEENVSNALQRTTGLPVGRKAGGRVNKQGAEARAEKLIRMAETAKKHVNKTTETLLQAPDEAVAKALKIAQAHI